MALLSAVHLGLPPPGCPHRQAIVAGHYHHYHYGCDGVDDRGWGCGYRTLQMMCSWLVAARGEAAGRLVPSLKEIQDSLVEMGDKPPSFAGSRDWIGTVEAALCLDYFYDVPGRLLHIRLGRDLEGELETLYAHFQGGGGPVMMGGGQDHASKGLLGVCSGPEGHHLLTLDPHYYGPAGSLSRPEAQARGWVSWRGLGSFQESSFYNLCLPQFRAKGPPRQCERGLPEARQAMRTSSLSPFQGIGCGWAPHAWHLLGASTWKEKPGRLSCPGQPFGVAGALQPSSGAAARPAPLPDHG